MSTTSKRILYVEDDRDTCEPVATVLSLEHYEMVQARTVAQALALVTSEIFDLVIIDWMLPGGPEIALCKKIISIQWKPQGYYGQYRI